MPIAENVILAADTRILYPDLVNLYGCTIGAKTFIGPFVEVQEDVTIGDRCVIGAGSVVSRDIPEDVFAAGNPCKPIRSLT